VILHPWWRFLRGFFGRLEKTAYFCEQKKEE